MSRASRPHTRRAQARGTSTEAPRHASRRMAREQALLQVLLAQRLRPIQVGALAERLGVSERTVERDLEHLRASRLPLRSRGGTGGGVWIDVTRTRPALQLDDAQVMVLLLALDALPADLPPALVETRELLRQQLADPQLF